MKTNAMSLTLKLSDEEATALHAKAAAEGLSLEERLRKLAQPKPTKDATSEPAGADWSNRFQCRFAKTGREPAAYR